MSKYDPLKAYLKGLDGRQVRLTFAEIEGILGFPLPDSRKVRAWWSNNPWNNVMTRAWLAAGYRTAQVDVAGEALSFVPEAGSPSGFSETTEKAPQPPTITPPPTQAVPERAKPHPLWGIWKGKVTLLPDYDYTQPADPEWGRVYDD
jgi:hypothetical protein